jgi:hypothetical protein
MRLPLLVTNNQTGDVAALPTESFGLHQAYHPQKDLRSMKIM